MKYVSCGFDSEIVKDIKSGEHKELFTKLLINQAIKELPDGKPVKLTLIISDIDEDVVIGNA